MHSTKRSLIGLAMAAALASTGVSAAGTDAASKANAQARTTPTQGNTRASDAVSEKTTQRESSPVTPTASMSSNAAAETTGSSSTAPGKGNWWTDADSDGDGKLSSTEATANAGLNASFSTIDADKDGFVTMDEYRSFYAKSAGKGEQHAAAHSAVVTRDVWVKLDANADSRISTAEAAANVGFQTSFATMDSNSDGFVTQAEYRAHAKAQK